MSSWCLIFLFFSVAAYLRLKNSKKYFPFFYYVNYKSKRKKTQNDRVKIFYILLLYFMMTIFSCLNG